MTFEEWWITKEYHTEHSVFVAEIAREAALAAWNESLTLERERCAKLCEELPYGNGLAGKTYAEAIRGVGMGADLAK